MFFFYRIILVYIYIILVIILVQTIRFEHENFVNSPYSLRRLDQDRNVRTRISYAGVSMTSNPQVKAVFLVGILYCNGSTSTCLRIDHGVFRNRGNGCFHDNYPLFTGEQLSCFEGEISRSAKNGSSPGIYTNYRLKQCHKPPTNVDGLQHHNLSWGWIVLTLDFHV